MSTIRLTLDASSAFAGLDRMAKQGRSLGKAFRILKPDLRADQKDHAAKAAGPDGAWAPRATGTSGRLTRGSRRYLGKTRRKSTRRPLGRLVTQVTYMASNAGVFATSRVPWSGVHQEGGRVGRGAVIPARPFLWLSDRIVERASEVLARIVAYAMEGR